MNSGKLEKLNNNMPESLRRAQLQLLTLVTAKAFREMPVLLLHLPSDRGLEKYAALTRTWMAKAKRSGEAEAKIIRLYENARCAGTWLRRLTGIKAEADIRQLVILLYRNIGIRLEGDIPGTFQAWCCYFAGAYTPEECRFMSAMDNGMITGLFGGGALEFSERITEGKPCCTACFRIGGER